MSRVELEIPDESLLALSLDAEHAGMELRLMAAAKLFEMKKLSSGAAAKLAGIPRVLFLAKLGELGVNTFDMTAEDFAKETRLV